MQFQLLKEEKLEIENHQLKMQMLKQQFENQQSSSNLVIQNFCARVSQKVKDIINIDIEKGAVDFKEEEKIGKTASKSLNLPKNNLKKITAE